MDFYRGKRVLITGAAGFIASHLVDALLALSAEVVGVDNFLTGRKENLTEALKNTNFTLIESDVINSPEVYLESLTNKMFDVIFHMASPASPPAYEKYPVETYLVNSLGTHNLLQYMLTTMPNAHVVYTSTSEVYGDPKENPQSETYWGNVNPNGPRSCYDESKRLGETICGVHTRNFGLNVRIARIFNTYGPRMNPADGRVIPQFFMQGLRGEPITIYGDGTQTRSFCYVSDLVSGLLALGATDGANGQTMNLGNPIEKSMLELAQIIQQMTCSKTQLKHEPLPVDDPRQRKPDTTKAKQILGWEPSVTFETGLAKTLAYFQQISHL
jgi:UDP-glucuronate decarboxylase